jgi:3-oxoacyl-[acyl-carrier protein] reductase
VVAFADPAAAALVTDGFDSGSQSMACACDIRDPDAIARLMAEVAAQLGPIDILVNTAAVYYGSPAGETDGASTDRMIDTNVKGTWNLINAVVPAMKQRRYGKIVNFASAAGLVGFGGYALYCASKAAVIMMTRALAIELAPFAININCLAPGPTATPMNEDVRNNPEMRPALQQTLALMPSGSGFSSPNDMANIVAFLVSDAARAMHGSCVVADEGLSAGF